MFIKDEIIIGNINVSNNTKSKFLNLLIFPDTNISANILPPIAIGQFIHAVNANALTIGKENPYRNEIIDMYSSAAQSN